MIHPASLSSYRVNDFIQFISNMLMIVKQHNPEKLQIRGIYEELLQYQSELQEYYKYDNHSGITPQLSRIDAQRDQAIICLRQIGQGYTYHHQDKLKEAGQILVDCIDKYGSQLYRLNYNAETAALKNLARDLQTQPDLKHAIELMHLEDVLNEMNQANLKFEKMFIKRLKESSQVAPKSYKQHHEIISEAYQKLVKHISAHATLSPSEQFNSLIRHMNENIEHFNQLRERRKQNPTMEPPVLSENLEFPETD